MSADCPFFRRINQPLNDLTNRLHFITRIGAALFFIHIIGFSIPYGASARLSISQMAGQYRDAIVQIHTFNQKGESVATGTGFFIDHAGTLVTSHHVLEGCNRAYVQTWRGEKGEIRGIIRDDTDLDLLTAGTSFGKTLPLPLSSSAGIRINEEVICFGNTRETPRTISMGRVTEIIPVHDFRVIKISAPILPGISGAPVLNRDGELIAVAAAYLDLDKGLFFAIPSDYLASLKKVNLPLKALPTRRTGLGATVQGTRLLGLGLYPFQPPPLTIYLKDGRQKRCDWAWTDGDTVYLVMQGKKFAVGYPKEEIDMGKSFKQ